jgi:hypothetical protein
VQLLCSTTMAEATRRPVDGPIALTRITDDKAIRRHQRDPFHSREAASALQDPYILLPQTLPWNEKTAPQGGRFGSPEPYRYGDSNPGFRTENRKMPG